MPGRKRGANGHDATTGETLTARAVAAFEALRKDEAAAVAAGDVDRAQFRRGQRVLLQQAVQRPDDAVDLARRFASVLVTEEAAARAAGDVRRAVDIFEIRVRVDELLQRVATLERQRAAEAGQADPKATQRGPGRDPWRAGIFYERLREAEEATPEPLTIERIAQHFRGLNAEHAIGIDPASLRRLIRRAKRGEMPE